MKAWERILGRQSATRFSLTDPTMADFFSFGGNDYPVINTTWGSGDEESLIRDNAVAYRNNGPVFALVQARLQVFSQIRFQWTRFSAGAPGDLFGSPELRLLETPWPGGTTADLLARMELDVSRAGTAFVRKGNGRLHVLNPDWTNVAIGSATDAAHPSEAPDATFEGLIYRPPNGRMQHFLPEEVAIYAPIPDPLRLFCGMSWISPVLTETQGDDLATMHKRKFFENAATPNLAIKFDPTVGVEAVREFKELLESEHRGAWNAYKTLYLGGGADPIPVGANFQQMAFAETQGKGESRLAAAAGVPPSWVGFSEGLQGSALNAGNFAAAKRRFGDGTMQHLWRNVAASLEPLLGASRNPSLAGAQLWFSTANVPFLSEDTKDAAEIQTAESVTITTLVKEGFTPDSAIAAVRAHDWTLLVHTGLVSVQLQTPGTTDTPTPQEGN